MSNKISPKSPTFFSSSPDIEYSQNVVGDDYNMSLQLKEKHGKLSDAQKTCKKWLRKFIKVAQKINEIPDVSRFSEYNIGVAITKDNKVRFYFFGNVYLDDDKKAPSKYFDNIESAINNVLLLFKKIGANRVIKKDNDHLIVKMSNIEQYLK